MAHLDPGRRAAAGFTPLIRNAASTNMVVMQKKLPPSLIPANLCGPHHSMTTKQATHPGDVHRLLPDYLHANEEIIIREWLERAQIDNNRLATAVSKTNGKEASLSTLQRLQHQNQRGWSK